MPSCRSVWQKPQSFWTMSDMRLLLEIRLQVREFTVTKQLRQHDNFSRVEQIIPAPEPKSFARQFIRRALVKYDDAIIFPVSQPLVEPSINALVAPPVAATNESAVCREQTVKF